MIGRLTGHISVVSLNQLIVDVRGVGYNVSVPAGTVGRLPETGDTEAQTLAIHTSVRDDAIALYGFASEREKELFERIISISRIGPKLGLALLSHMRPDDIIRHTRAENTGAFKEVSGIGKKTARRLILELQSKLEDLSLQTGTTEQTTDLQESRRRELRSALNSLGYDSQAISHAMTHIEDQLSEDRELEALVRSALDILT